jgi:hypothetical protein
MVSGPLETPSGISFVSNFRWIDHRKDPLAWPAIPSYLIRLLDQVTGFPAATSFVSEN